MTGGMPQAAGVMDASAPPEPNGSRVGLIGRHPWRVLIVAVVLTIGYVGWWAGYAWVHYESRYTELEPGATADFGPATTRLVSLTVTDRLYGVTGAVPAFAAPGAQWVVAQVEVTRHDPDGVLLCTRMELLGGDRRTWTPAYAPVSRELPSCLSDEGAPEEPTVVELLYEVPAADSTRLVGVALDDPASSARVPVLTPPR